jgi:hypothetical protein
MTRPRRSQDHRRRCKGIEDQGEHERIALVNVVRPSRMRDLRSVLMLDSNVITMYETIPLFGDVECLVTIVESQLRFRHRITTI